MHPIAEQIATEYLQIADAVFGNRIVGFYVVGSAAYDAFRPKQSDLDFIAVLDEHRAGDCELIRKAQRRSLVRDARRNVLRARFQGGACNGAYVAAGDLTRPVSEIKPVGSHVGHRHTCGEAFDVNPVQWKTLAERGLALRGASPAELGLDPQPEQLRQWNLGNLNSYWTRSATKAAAGQSPNSWFHTPRWVTAWGVLGPVRLHHTIATGGIVTKEQAADYALSTFDASWHPIIREALAYHRGGKADPAFRDRAHRYATTGAFGLHVIESANAL